MELPDMSRKIFGSTLSRRALLRAAAGVASASALSAVPWSTDRAMAQDLSGEITVQFESRGGLLETEVTTAIADLTGTNPAAAVTVAEKPAGDYLNDLVLKFMAGEAPDVFLVNSIATAQLASSGFVMPLDPTLEAWNDWSQYPEIVRTNLKFQEQTWGLPYSVDTHFLYYRKEIFQQLGLPVPWQPATLDDVLAAARTIKAANADLIPLVLFAGANPGNSTAMRGFLPMLRAYGGTLKDEDGKWIIESCAIQDALGFYELTYQTEQLVPQSVMTSVNAANAMRMAFAKGEAGIMFDGSWVWDDWAKALPDIEQSIGYVLHPTSDGSSPFTLGGFGNTWFINSQTKHPELAWAFVAAMNGVGVVTRLNLDDPHVPARSDSIADPGFQDSAFNKAMVETIDSMVMLGPDPSYQELVGIIQNATGIVATGEVNATEAARRYGDELTRVLGADNVVKQTCA